MTANVNGLLVSLDTLLHRLGRDPSPPLAMIDAEAPPAPRPSPRPPRLPLVGAAAARRACAALLDAREVAALSRAGLF